MVKKCIVDKNSILVEPVDFRHQIGRHLDIVAAEKCLISLRDRYRLLTNNFSFPWIQMEVRYTCLAHWQAFE